VTLIPNLLAVFQQGSNPPTRLEVFKTDGDLNNANGPHNRYVYIDGQLRLIAAIWDQEFVGFEHSAHP